jgi:hypothetical protein
VNIIDIKIAKEEDSFVSHYLLQPETIISNVESNISSAKPAHSPDGEKL